jgi:hydrogenase-4 component F
VFGVASLLLAALYLFGQRDIKRMLAYSSVEHMGILAIGVSFGAPIALAGVLLHVLAHAAAKGNAFMGAGVLVHKFGTKRLAAMRGGLDVLPWSGPLFLLAILALGAMPPFGIFRSEFEIVEGGFASASTVTAAILIIGVTVAFFGLAATTTQILLVPRTPPVRPPAVPARPAVPAPPPVPTPALATVRGAGGTASPQADGAASARTPEPAAKAAAAAAVPRGEPSAWMVVPVLAGALVLLVLGVHPPADLTGLLARAVRELSGVR